MPASAEQLFSSLPSGISTPPGQPSAWVFSPEFKQLRRSIKQAGLLDPNPFYYAWRIPITLGLFALGVWLLLLVESLAGQLLLAVYFAVVFNQVSFFVHDAGHQQVCRRQWKNGMIGTFTANLLLGMSYAWWCHNHNRHHKYPNQPHLDPDINIPVLAFWPGQARARRGLARAIVKYQHYLFFPLMMLGSVSKRRGVILFLKRMRFKYRWLEITLVVVHYVVYFAFVFSVMSPGRALGFVAVHQLLYGLFLTTAFAPNHKGRPIVENKPDLDFLHYQVLTARNLISNRAVDFWYGGINYQIEHHLFPRIPRSRLRQARSIIRPFCKRNGFTYYETGVIQTYRDILIHMRDASLPLRTKGARTVPHSAGTAKSVRS